MGVRARVEIFALSKSGRTTSESDKILKIKRSTVYRINWKGLLKPRRPVRRSNRRTFLDSMGELAKELHVSRTTRQRAVRENCTLAKGGGEQQQGICQEENMYCTTEARRSRRAPLCRFL